MDIKNINKILIIQLKQIGDCLLTTPIIKVLRDNFNTTHIAFLIEKHCYDVVSYNPYLNEIIVLDRERYNDWRYYINQLLEIKKKKFDLVIDFLGTGRSALITFISGAKYKVGYEGKFRKYFYNVVVKRDNKPKYVVDFKLDALRRIGIYPKDENYMQPLFFINKEAEEFAIKFFTQNNITTSDLIITISSTSRRGYRMWNPTKWAILCDYLIKEYNAKIILTYAPNEKIYVEEIRAKIKETKNVYLPQTNNLKGLGAIIKRSNLHIGVASGTKHLATALDIPTITIYWQRESISWTYPSDRHIGIEKDNIDEIKVDEVKYAVSKLLKKI